MLKAQSLTSLLFVYDTYKFMGVSDTILHAALLDLAEAVLHKFLR